MTSRPSAVTTTSGSNVRFDSAPVGWNTPATAGSGAIETPSTANTHAGITALELTITDSLMPVAVTVYLKSTFGKTFRYNTDDASSAATCGGTFAPPSTRIEKLPSADWNPTPLAIHEFAVERSPPGLAGSLTTRVSMFDQPPFASLKWTGADETCTVRVPSAFLNTVPVAVRAETSSTDNTGSNPVAAGGAAFFRASANTSDNGCGVGRAFSLAVGSNATPVGNGCGDNAEIDS